MGACSRQPPYHKHYFFATSDEVPEMSLRINTVCIFLTMESAVELNRHYWNSCYITWIFRKVFTKTVQLSRDTLGEQKVLESLFFRLSESLKFKIFPLVGTIVLPPRYTGFITNLSFWATLGLKHMNHVKLFSRLEPTFHMQDCSHYEMWEKRQYLLYFSLSSSNK